MVLSRDSRGAKFGIFNSGHVMGHRDNARDIQHVVVFWLAYRSADGAWMFQCTTVWQHGYMDLLAGGYRSIA